MPRVRATSCAALRRPRCLHVSPARTVMPGVVLVLAALPVDDLRIACDLLGRGSVSAAPVSGFYQERPEAGPAPQRTGYGLAGLLHLRLSLRLTGPASLKALAEHTLMGLRAGEARSGLAALMMPSAGSTSTAVHLCRSPSQRVRTSPVRSAPVAVLSCCTGQPARSGSQ